MLSYIPSSGVAVCAQVGVSPGQGGSSWGVDGVEKREVGPWRSSGLAMGVKMWALGHLPRQVSVGGCRTGWENGLVQWGLGAL